MRSHAFLVLLGACEFGVAVPSKAEDVDAAIDASDVCSTAGLQCAQPGVTIACGDACWVGCRETTDYAVAKQRCIDWGGELARLDSDAEQQCVNTTFAGSARWLGLEQATTTVLLDGWAWGGTVAATYVNWSGGQPNDADGNESGEEQCAYMSNPSGLWQDTPCTALFGAFACRR